MTLPWHGRSPIPTLPSRFPCNTLKYSGGERNGKKMTEEGKTRLQGALRCLATKPRVSLSRSFGQGTGQTLLLNFAFLCRASAQQCISVAVA